MTLHIALFLLLHLGQPRSIRRAIDLANVAADIASTDASESEAEALAAIAIHESRATWHVTGDHGQAFGPFQVRGPDASAREALRLLRWSTGVCGDTSLYAGCGRCGACPAIAASLVDPTLPRS